jgi:integrase/recombinase XerC
MKDSFLLYIEHEKRYSAHTVVNYKIDLDQFEEFLLQTYELENSAQAQYQQIRSWLLHLSENEIQARSINRKIACLKSYYKFLRKNDYIKLDPTLRIKTLKTAKKLPEFLDKENFNVQLDLLTENSDFLKIQERVILELLYGTGMRLAELINLKDQDINPYSNLIKVLGKGNKERFIPINTTLLEVIKHYLIAKKTLPEGNPEHYFIVTTKNEKAYSAYVYRIVKRNLSIITTADKKSPHVLRHTFATHLLNNGADLNAIKDLLGHSSLAATQVYTHNSIEKLKSIFNKAHPKA